MKTVEIETDNRRPEGPMYALGRLPETAIGTVRQLLGVLDEDIEHIEQTLSRLDELRSYLVKRDNQSLARLLEQVRTESDSCTSCDRRRQAIRKHLAQMLGCSIEHVTLSALVQVVSEPTKVALAQRQGKLRDLAAAIKKEVLSTSMLLSDCARVNRLLLKGILRFKNPETVTYNSSGAASVHNDGSFFSSKF